MEVKLLDDGTYVGTHLVDATNFPKWLYRFPPSSSGRESSIVPHLHQPLILLVFRFRHLGGCLAVSHCVV